MEKIRIAGNAPDLQTELKRLGIAPTSKKITVTDFHSQVHYAIGFDDEYESELWLLVLDGWRPLGGKIETEAEFRRREEARQKYLEAEERIAQEARKQGMTAQEFAEKFPDHPSVLAALTER